MTSPNARPGGYLRSLAFSRSGSSSLQPCCHYQTRLSLGRSSHSPAAALGVKRLTVKGDSQLLVNFSNKVYEQKDEHMEAYLAEVRKMEKQFSGLEL